jgi:hypothetical protein
MRVPLAASVVSRSMQSANSTSKGTLIQAKCACGGGCARCRQTPVLQAKFTISRSNDKYEQEADRAADRVMSTPQSTIQKKPG